MVALSDFAGKAVVLNLWATECGGCRIELPTFAKLDRTFQGDDLRVIGVSMDVTYDGLKTTDEAWTRVTPFARTHGLDYTILVDDGRVEKAYSVTAMPATYLIDKRGRIAAKYVGIVDAGNLTANIKTLLMERR
jgi:peroxiredoxin